MHLECTFGDFQPIDLFSFNQFELFDPLEWVEITPLEFSIESCYALTTNTLDIRNNSQLNGLNVPDASLVSVKCTQDVLDLMRIGHRNRAVGATALNERSSRSHRQTFFILLFV